MPTYEYECTACEHEFEEFQQMTAKPLKKCPSCGKAALRRLIGTGAAVVFKGSGFYQTDYRSESYKKAAEAEGKAASPTPPASDAAKDAPAKDGASKESTSKDGSSKEGPSKDGTSKDGSIKTGSSKDAPVRESSPKKSSSKASGSQPGAESRPSRRRAGAGSTGSPAATRTPIKRKKS
ncbi:MAG: FmdB family zinc ribbon protein [Planctomycetota bacterium]|nr:FmdB family zinc ribbon protein [Planctomycetota bacterium]